jgi:hypothetical protein
MTHDDLDRFHQELAFVLKAKAPLELDCTGWRIQSRRRRARLLSQYQHRLREKLPPQQPVSNASDVQSLACPAQANADPHGNIGSFDGSNLNPAEKSWLTLAGELPDRFQAALQTFSATRSFTPVLEGLTVRGLALQQLRKVLRWPLIYLSAVLLLSVLGLSLFWYQVLPQIAIVRADTPMATQAMSWDFQAWLPGLIIGIALIAVGFMLFLLCGGFFRLLLWLGGASYVDSLCASTAQRIIPQLLYAGASSEQAISTSYALSGLKPEKQHRYFPIHRSTDHDVWLQGSEYWMLIADLHLTRLKMLFPILTVTLIGGSVALIYAVAIYGPVVVMLRSFSVPGG